MRIFIFHYKLRKGLGPEFIKKIEEVAMDDLPSELSEYEIKEMAKSEFWSRRIAKGTREREVIITDILTA